MKIFGNFWSIGHRCGLAALVVMFTMAISCENMAQGVSEGETTIGIVVKCFQSERSSDQSLQFLRPTHQNFNFISVSGRFGRIFCPFFMARIQFPHMSSALTASFSVRQPPNEPFVLSCPPAGPRLPCGCRRRCTGFPSASSWP